MQRQRMQSHLQRLLGSGVWQDHDGPKGQTCVRQGPLSCSRDLFGLNIGSSRKCTTSSTLTGGTLPLYEAMSAWVAFLTIHVQTLRTEHGLVLTTGCLLRRRVSLWILFRGRREVRLRHPFFFSSNPSMQFGVGDGMARAILMDQTLSPSGRKCQTSRRVPKRWWYGMIEAFLFPRDIIVVFKCVGVCLVVIAIVKNNEKSFGHCGI